MIGWQLPHAVKLGEREYRIHADYRDILDIIQRLSDPDEDEYVRLYVALHLFYADFKAIPPDLQQDAARQMMLFIAGGVEDSGPPGPKLFDWEQDWDMIVSGINKVAGCEVRALPFCHWWTFLAWFGAIGEGQFSTVVSIRDKLRRGKKLEKWEQEYYRQNRARVTLRPRYTAEELAEQERLKKLLGE